MIIIDITGLVFQHIHSCINVCKLKTQDNGVYDHNIISNYVIKAISDDIFTYEKKFQEFNKQGIVICTDDTHRGNWRSQVYKPYKKCRRKENDPVPVAKIFERVNEFIKQLSLNTKIKVISVQSAEADDCILTLAKNCSCETIIISSDKDMIQAQKNPLVKQYSPMTKKWVTYESKDVNNLDEWIIEHVVLGDVSDGVPRIFDEADYTDEFVKYLNSNNINTSDVDDGIVDSFIKDNPGCSVWVKHRLGPKTIQKMIREGSINELINKYKTNYDRNKKLVLTEGIPEYISNGVMCLFNKEKLLTSSNTSDFMEYTDMIGIDVPANTSILVPRDVVTIDDFF